MKFSTIDGILSPVDSTTMEEYWLQLITYEHELHRNEERGAGLIKNTASRRGVSGQIR